MARAEEQWDKPKVVPRFLPPRLGQVMVLYLAYEAFRPLSTMWHRFLGLDEKLG